MEEREGEGEREGDRDRDTERGRERKTSEGRTHTCILQKFSANPNVNNFDQSLALSGT